MKRTIFSYWTQFVVVLVAMFALSSCGDETTDVLPSGPTITINLAKSEIAVGETTTATYTVSSEERLDKILVNQNGVENDVIEKFDSNKSHGGTITVSGKEEGEVKITITAFDKKEGKSQQVAVVKVVKATTPIAIKTVNAVLMGAQKNATTGSFANATTGEVFKLAAAKSNAAKIDLVYIVGSASNGQGAVIGSPKDNSVEFIFKEVKGWSKRNNTRFKNSSMSEKDFNEITDGNQINAAYEAGTTPTNEGVAENSSSRVNQLAKGKVFTFKTEAGKAAVAYVSDLNAKDSGKIVLNIKIVD